MGLRIPSGWNQFPDGSRAIEPRVLIRRDFEIERDHAVLLRRVGPFTKHETPLGAGVGLAQHAAGGASA